ncbi:anthranilate synthase component I family protein [Flavobacteriaceae bacterium]|nr:anthranilate synthase component I family protein [Flavobacteriaceae bacterium]
MLADTITPVSLYLKIRDKYANTVLLESSDYHSKEDSFSFVCFDPLVTLKAEGDVFSYFEHGHQVGQEQIEGNFYELFDQFRDKLKVKGADEYASFNGFYGYFSYDAVQYFEDLKLKNPDADSSIPEMQYSFYRFVIAINHFKNELLIIENVPEASSSKMQDITTLLSNQSFGLYDFKLKGAQSSNISDEQFRSCVAKAKSHCKRGDVFQLVLSRQFSQEFTGDEFNVYRALRSINPSPYLFYFDYGSFKLMGSSPEAQIKIQEGKAIINPIAGTFRRTGDDIKDAELAKKLAEDKKENAEHVMLVDLARNDLSIHGNEVAVKIFKEVQYFSHVIHLVSTVQGTLKNGHSNRVVGATFPAGTLSGAPKYRAMQLIDQYENQKRGFYGGAVGVIGLNNDVNLAIAIRSFVSKNNQLYSQAGAGIVIDSSEEGELQEVNNKLEALNKALILAEEI